MAATISSALAPCLDDTQLLSYAQGELGSAVRERLDLHLAQCAACCELVAETAKLLEADGAESPVELTQPAADGALGAPGAPAECVSVGRYQLLSTLGRGGTGIVYAAHDPELHRRVAIKLLRGDRLERSSDDSQARLLREARAMARVSHPHVVAIYDVGVWSGQVFVAMELVEGHTLRTLLGDKRVPWRTRLDWVLEAGRGLCAAHAAGLVHRDFKPENVLVGHDGRVRVTDFGLAKPVRGEVEGKEKGTTTGAASPLDVLTTVTLTGHMTGTPAYMAPEQFLGTTTDARVDQFAFCVVLHEALFGARPFAGKALEEIARNVLESRVTAVGGAIPSDVPEGFRSVILRGLARAPDERHPTLEHVLRELESLRGKGGEARTRVAFAPEIPVEHASTSVEAPPTPFVHRRRRLVAAAAAIVLVGAGVAIASVSARRASVPPPPIASSRGEVPSVPAALEETVPSVRAPSATAPASRAVRASAHPSALPGRGSAPVERSRAHGGKRSKPLGDRVQNPF